MKRRRQCKKCPWKVGVNPREIPGEYCEAKHRALKSTIADPETSQVTGGLRLMACHETTGGEEIPCVGWLVNQIGDGGNLPLRLAVILGRVDANVETVGPQHETFEATLPTDLP
jgi:hypothetical protein